MTNTSKSVTTAMLCAAAVSAQFVAGKAMRDALFLTTYDVSALPTMLVITALFSIVLVSVHARAGRFLAPATLIPASFVVSGFLFLGEWFLRASAPSMVAVLVYLHVSVAGPLLASGFWLIVSDSFSPRTAKKGVGRIAAAGTLGGLAGALAAERVATTLGVPGMLVVLGSLQFVSAALVRVLALRAVRFGPRPVDGEGVELSQPIASGLRLIAERPYLRRIAVLVLLGTTSATLVDYLFKAAAVEAFGPGDGLLRFFALYYGLTSLVSFVLQLLASRPALERFGIAGTTSTPSLALLGGLLADFVVPGFASLAVARSGEAIFRASWFRAGYELFFTPIPTAEKRATKSLIDVMFDRLGDAVGGALIPLAILAPADVQSTVILSVALIASLGALFAASQLSRWYVRTLESRLLDRGSSIPLVEPVDATTAVIVREVRMREALTGRTNTGAVTQATVAAAADPILEAVRIIRASDRRGTIRLLSREEGIPSLLVPHVISLLADDAVADYALFALRKVAEEHVGQLTDALLDPGQAFAIRRRLARVFSVCVSQRAADGLLAALDDIRFDVRFQAARSLSAVMSRNEGIQADPERVYEIVLREVAVGRPVWEGRRLLDGFVSASPLDEFVRDRAGQSLAHVFTLLSLVLPREPLQIAFRSLQSDDNHLRGTALEYLEGVLPPRVRQPLWPFLLRHRTPAGAARPERVAELLRASDSATLQSVAAKWDRGRLAGFEHA